jgi:hypothetical protein
MKSSGIHMPIITLQLNDFKSNIATPPDCCPYCGFNEFQRWGNGAKTVQDACPEIGEYRRYRCNGCGRTFRHYGQMVDKTRLTRRIHKIAGIAWALGLSTRDVVAVLAECGIELSYMTVWRDGNNIVNRYKDLFDPNLLGRLSTNRLRLKNNEIPVGTSISLDLGNGKIIELGCIDTTECQILLDWLAPIIDYEIKINFTDAQILAV